MRVIFDPPYIYINVYMKKYDSQANRLLRTLTGASQGKTRFALNSHFAARRSGLPPLQARASPSLERRCLSCSGFALALQHLVCC